ncbi:MAG: MerR family transcriptional regulator, partial [Lachnospiraceae bacterium]|nr:MerR family transcriptional regulator [Lachnospiraceae bacterium]
MKIKEIEELLPITRANIRYYEKEGLLKPHREKNGYRDYDEEDVQRLKQIIIFRKLGISILDIKRILWDGVPASEVVKQNMKLLAKQMEELDAAIEVSRKMADDVNLDSAFPTEKYWEMINTREQTGGLFNDYLKDYAEFSGRMFTHMWGSVFFYDMESRVKKSGWKLALLIVLCICVWRGFMQKYVLHVNSFWGAFLYPLFLFLALSLCVLPPYLIDWIYTKKYGRIQPAAEADAQS